MPTENQPELSQNGRDAEPRKWSDEWVEQRYAEVEAEVAAMPPLAEWTEEQKRHGGLWTLKLIQETFADVPPEEWSAEPSDLAEQFRHYMYGTPKKKPLRYE